MSKFFTGPDLIAFYFNVIQSPYVVIHTSKFIHTSNEFKSPIIIVWTYWHIFNTELICKGQCLLSIRFFTSFNMSTRVINKCITVLIIDCLFDLDWLFDCEIKMSKFKQFLVLNKKGWKSAFSVTFVIYNNKWKIPTQTLCRTYLVSNQYFLINK